MKGTPGNTILVLQNGVAVRLVSPASLIPARVLLFAPVQVVSRVSFHTHVIVSVSMNVTTTKGRRRRGRRSSRVPSRVPSTTLHTVATLVKVTMLVADADITLTMLTSTTGGASVRVEFSAGTRTVLTFVGSGSKGTAVIVVVGTAVVIARMARKTIGHAVDEDDRTDGIVDVHVPELAPAAKKEETEITTALGMQATGPAEPATCNTAAGQDGGEDGRRASRISASVTSHICNPTSGRVGSGATPPGNSITTKWFDIAVALGPEMDPLARPGPLPHRVPIKAGVPGHHHPGSTTRSPRNNEATTHPSIDGHMD